MCNECEIRCCDEPMCLSPTVFRKSSSLDTVHSSRQRTNIVDIIRSTRIKFYVCQEKEGIENMEQWLWNLKSGEESSHTHTPDTYSCWTSMSKIQLNDLRWYRECEMWNVNPHTFLVFFIFGLIKKKRDGHLYEFFCGHHRGSLIPNRLFINVKTQKRPLQLALLHQQTIVMNGYK